MQFLKKSKTHPEMHEGDARVLSAAELEGTAPWKGVSNAPTLVTLRALRTNVERC